MDLPENVSPAPPSAPRKIALFGGSFDPVHTGHLAIAEAAREQAGVERVIFLPAARSPHKTEGPTAEAEDRLRMLRLATADRPGLEVSDWEVRRPPPNYSWQTAERFVNDGSANAEWFWLMGADQWEALDRWARPDFLASLVIFLVFARDGVNPRERKGVRALFLRGEFPGSSTEARRLLAAGESADALIGKPWLAEVRRLYTTR